MHTVRLARGRRRPLNNRPRDRVEAIHLRDDLPLPPLPWQDGHALYLAPPPDAGEHGSEWRHVIYGGVFPYEAARDALAWLGYADGPDHGGRKELESALFAFTVDKRGVYIEGTLSLSSCAWAAGRALHPGPRVPGWLDGFDEVREACQRHLEDHLADPSRYRRPTGPGRGGTAAHAQRAGSGWRALLADVLGKAVQGALGALIAGTATLVGVPAAGALGGAVNAILDKAIDHAKGRPEQPAAGTAAHHGLASGQAEEQARTPPAAPPEGQAGTAGMTGPEPAPDRRAVQVLDVIDMTAQLIVALNLPRELARHLWEKPELRVVSKTAYRDRDKKLPDPQQAILSSMLAPDLLRVRDACGVKPGAALHRYLSDPLEAEEREDLAENRKSVLDHLRPGLTPLGRWPASAEQPLVAGQQFAVNAILQETGGPYGGIFSVNGPPGTGKTTMLRDLIAEIVVRRAQALAALKRPSDGFPDAARVPLAPGDLKNRKTWRLDPKLVGFEIVVASSNNGAVENITRELPTVGALGKDWRGPTEDLPDAHAMPDYFAEQATAFLGEPAWGVIAVPLGNAERRRAFRERFWQDWEHSGAEMREELYQLSREDVSAQEWQAAVAAFTSAREAARKLADARAAAVEPRWLDLSFDEQEKTAPWADEKWAEARTEVFVAAMGLHRVFIAANAEKVRDNMHQFLSLLSRGEDAPQGPAALAAWQTLFLLVPVISTTFASCGRLLESLGQEELGWLLVDEAGQALPQAAVGALWRSRRAIIVGDPLQLEPICQVPDGVQAVLREEYRLGPGWEPGATSVQVLADRQNRWGTSIPRDGGDPVWVGAPLWVHRRCELPMFSVSNEVAYRGRMVYGTEEKPFPGGTHGDFPESRWYSVTGPPGKGKWLPSQGEVLMRALRKLHDEYGVPLAEIFVISPFKDVAEECRELIRGRRTAGPGEDLAYGVASLFGDELDGRATGPAYVDARKEEMATFLRSNVGTVHTMQGKQADVVLFVLGTGHQGQARDWVVNQVNLLNVAVSRARRRLFVIGGHQEWSMGNFAVLRRHVKLWHGDVNG